MASSGGAGVFGLLEQGDVAGVGELMRHRLDLLDDEVQSLRSLSVDYLTRAWAFDGSVSQDQARCAAIIGTATLPISKLKLESRWVGIVDDPDLAVDVLRQREYDFRSQWVEAVASNPQKAGVAVRRLVHLGLADRPMSDSYTLALITHPLSFDLTGNAKSIHDLLRLNPDLFELDFWRLFEVEGTSDRSLAHTAQYGFEGTEPVPDSWHSAIVGAVTDGLIDRPRVLDETLSALESGFRQYRSRWFSELHTMLEPTIDESCERSVQYLRLAGSPVGPAVTIALRELARIQAAGQLDPNLVLEHIVPTLTTKAKSSAMRALGILGASRDEISQSGDIEGLSQANLVAARALGHRAKDVQLATIRLLQSWNPVPDRDLATVIDAALDGCDPLAVSSLDAWLGTGTQTARPRVSWTRPRSRFALCPTQVHWTSDDNVVPVSPEPKELMSRVAAMLEHGSDADEFEVLIAAMLRTPALAAGTERAVETLERRSIEVQRQRDDREAVPVANLVQCWLNHEADAPHWARRVDSSGWRTPSKVDRLLAARVDELARVLRTGGTKQLLSTPTHMGGHLSPREFAERYIAMLDRNVEPMPVDLQVALWRLAPEPDLLDQADRMLQSVEHTHVGPIRQWLRQWPVDCDADERRLVQRSVSVKSTEVQGRRTLHYSLAIDDRDSTGTCLEDMQVGLAPRDAFDISYRASLMPSATGVWSRATASALSMHTDTLGSTNTAHERALERYFDPNSPFGSGQHLALAVGLAANDQSVRAVSSDLVIQTMEDGRLDPERLGCELGSLTQDRLLITARWTTALLQAMDASAVCTGLGAEVLWSALRQTDPAAPNRILPLLEALERTTIVLGDAGPKPDAIEILRQLAGSSASGRTAKRLLETLSQT